MSQLTRSILELCYIQGSEKIFLVCSVEEILSNRSERERLQDSFKYSSVLLWNVEFGFMSVQAEWARMGSFVCTWTAGAQTRTQRNGIKATHTFSSSRLSRRKHGRSTSPTLPMPRMPKSSLQPWRMYSSSPSTPPLPWRPLTRGRIVLLLWTGWRYNFCSILADLTLFLLNCYLL